ncbi:hypothetical protein LZ30DRAFT_74197 [Colletotrichum cereale]|nr:hypothetical protein LZ30DRAFT_74197 [Colletotrichum cereale]
MPSPLDSEQPARRFLRRGAVTGLVDPSAGDPSLQGSQAESPAEAPVPDWERYDMAPRRRQAGRPAVPGLPVIPQAHAQRARRFRLGLWPFFGFATIAGVLFTWFTVSTVYPPRREETEAIMAGTKDAENVKAGTPWWEISRLVAGIFFRSIATAWGGYRLINRGSRCLVDFLSRGSFARNIIDNEPLVICITLLGYAVLPTVTSVIWTTALPGFCYAEHNVLRFWPPRKRNDIKAILDGWIGLATIHVKAEGSFARVIKCKITLGRVLVWMLGVGVWTTAEIYYGPCRYFSFVWRLWFSVMGISFGSWFLGNAEALIVKKREAVGLVHLEFVAYLIIFYVARWVDLQGYCTSPNCW